MCKKCQKPNAMVLAFSRGKEANPKLGIDPVLPEIVFSSRAKRLEGRCLFFAISTEKDKLSLFTQVACWCLGKTRTSSPLPGASGTFSISTFACSECLSEDVTVAIIIFCSV